MNQVFMLLYHTMKKTIVIKISYVPVPFLDYTFYPSQLTAEGAIGTGAADLIAFGRPYLSNPDLVERFTNGWPLAELAPYDQWFTPPYEDLGTAIALLS